MRRVVHSGAARRRAAVLAVLLASSTAGCSFEGEAMECAAGDRPCDDAPPVLSQAAAPAFIQPELCIAHPTTGEVLVFNAADDGEREPKRRLGTDQTGIDGPHGIAFADAHGEMLVAESDRITTWGIGDVGNVAPRRILAFQARRIGYDSTRDQLLAVAENRLFVFPRTAAGNPTAAVIRSVAGDPAHPWTANRVLYDEVRDEIIIVTRDMLTVHDASLVDATPKLAVYRSEESGAFLDAAVNVATGEIYALREANQRDWYVRRYTRAPSGNRLDERSAWRVPEDDEGVHGYGRDVAGFGIDVEHNEAVIVSGVFADARLWVLDLATGAFKLRIDGPRTQLASPSSMTVNAARHEYTVGQVDSHSLDTFTRPNVTRAPNDAEPRRIGRAFGERALSMAADVARNELYVTARNDPAVHVVSLATGAEIRRVVDPGHPKGGTLLFDASADRLFVLDKSVRMYDRPTGETMVPVATFGEGSDFFDMALDLDHQRLIANGYRTVVGFSLQSGSTSPLFQFTPAVPLIDTALVGRPFPGSPPRGIRHIVVHNNQLFASAFDGRLAVFAMIGSPPLPVNPPVFRNISDALYDDNDFLIDNRAPKALHVVRRDRIDTYAPGLFAGSKPVSSTVWRKSDLGAVDAIALCR